MTQDYDVIVIGGGPMGLCSAYNCAKAGKRVLLLERFSPKTICCLGIPAATLIYSNSLI